MSDLHESKRRINWGAAPFGIGSGILIVYLSGLAKGRPTLHPIFAIIGFGLVFIGWLMLRRGQDTQ